MYQRCIILFLVFFFMLSGAAYESRIWMDVNGNKYRGRFVRELFGKLTVETDDGEKKVFELEELSELDQKYLRTMVPPEMEIEVKTQSALIPLREEPYSKTETVRRRHKAIATITKKSQRPFTSRLKVEIFMIAEEVEDSNYILLGRKEDSFIFPSTSKNTEIRIESDLVKTVVFRVSGEMKGGDFAGYILVISTLKGEPVVLKSNLPSWVEDEKVIENLRELSISGAASVCSRHFDKTGNKVPPPRPKY